MVPWLLENPGVTYDEIAARFGGTVDDVAADLDTLGYCGLPGYGGGDLVEVTTFGDAVTVRMADFFRRPLRLSLREAVTLVLAARSLLEVEGLPESSALRRALSRLEALLPVGRAAHQEPVRVAVDLHTEGEEHIVPIRSAIADNRVLSIVYRSASKKETTTRLVEPWALTSAGGAWYLRGHCRVAGGHRDFRLDRIVSLEVTPDRTRAAPRGELDHPPGYRPAAEDMVAVIELHRSAWWFSEAVPVDAVSDEGEPRRAWRTVTLRTRELDWLARVVLSLGEAARVRSPRALEDRVRYLALTLREVYGPARAKDPRPPVER